MSSPTRNSNPLFLWNLIFSHSFIPTGSNAKVNLYTSGSLVASSTSLQSALETPSISTVTPYSITPTTSSNSPMEDAMAEEEEDDRNSLFSPGPTFVDDLEDDMDDEKMMVRTAILSNL